MPEPAFQHWENIDHYINVALDFYLQYTAACADFIV